MDSFRQFIENYTSLSDNDWEQISMCFEKRVLEKDEILLQEGKTCRFLYFIKSGFVRGFYHHDGKEITSWFAYENDALTSMYSFISQKPSFETIEVLEDCILYEISYENVQFLFKKYPEFNLIGRLITEKYYIKLEERTMSLQFQSATERYLKILQEQPLLLQKASLGMLASYLGISQETLSRIRKKIQ